MPSPLSNLRFRTIALFVLVGGGLICLAVTRPFLQQRDELPLGLARAFTISRELSQGNRDASAVVHVTPITVSLDGTIWATGNPFPWITVWDSSGQIVSSIDIGRNKSQMGVCSLSLSPDKRHLASGHFDGSIRVWNVRTRRLVTTFLFHTDAVTALATSHDASLLCSGSKDGSIVVWDLDTSRRRAIVDAHQTSVRCLVCRPDVNHAASISSDGRIVLWDMENGERLGSMLHQGAGDYVSLAVSSDGKHLASLAGSIGIWDMDTRVKEMEIPEPRNGRYMSVAFLGKAVLTVGELDIENRYEGAIRAFSDRGVELFTQMSESRSCPFVFSGPGDTEFMTVDYSGMVKFWRLRPTSITVGAENPIR